MAILNDSKLAIERLKDNENKFDIFINTSATYQTNETTPRTVEALPSIVSRIISRYITLNYKGNWATSTAYVVNDIAKFSDNVIYICTAAHTSGTFATDLAAKKWQVYQGVTLVDLLGNNGSTLVGYKLTGTGTVLRTLLDKILENVSLADFGAVGDGTINDSTAFTNFESVYSGKTIDLKSKTFLVSSIPTANVYINGTFKIGSLNYPAWQNRAILSGSKQGLDLDAGAGSGIDGAYAGGLLHVPTLSGRSSYDLYGLFASQNCVVKGPVGATATSSIYTSVYGNRSAALAARQGLITVPQGVIAASEESVIDGGFRGFIGSSIYSFCLNESNVVLAARNSCSGSRNGANISTDNCDTGRGGKALFVVTVKADGTLDNVGFRTGNDGTTIFNGRRYQVGDPLVFFDTLAPSYVSPVVTVGSVDVNGAITSFAYSSYGSGMTPGVGYVNAKVDNDTGDFSTNISAIACYTTGLCSTNLSQSSSIAGNIGAGNYSGDTNQSTGTYSYTLGSSGSFSTADRAGCLSSSGSTSSGVLSLVLSGNICSATADGAVAMGRRTLNNQTRSFAIGDSGSGSASTANRKIHLFSNGNIQAAGTITGSTTFTDYAEYFENDLKCVIPLGTLVSRNGRKVKPCSVGDSVLGVVSGTALIAAGDSPFTWSQRYLTGEFGETLYEEIPDPDWEEFIPNPDYKQYVINPNPKIEIDVYKQFDDNGNFIKNVEIPHISESFIKNPEPQDFIKNPKERQLVKVPIENPEYKEHIENVPRSQRPEEWSCIGLLGQVHVRVSESVKVDDFLKAGEGIGEPSEEVTNLQVMEIRKPFDSSKGYAVAFCLLK